MRRLVELHGGTVHAQSEGPGQGSEFIVRLPVAQADQQAQPEIASRARQAVVSTARILVVDDNRDSGDTLSTLMRLKGHDVRTARDGLEAIDLVAQFTPDVRVLVDVGDAKNEVGCEVDATYCASSPAEKDTFIIALTGVGTARRRAEVRRSRLLGASGQAS